MVAEATSAAGITNFVHVSALNVDPDSPSLFLKSKVGWICRNYIIGTCVSIFVSLKERKLYKQYVPLLLWCVLQI